MKTFLWELLLVAFPKVLAGVGTILVNFAILRTLGPEAFGAYSLCMAAILLADGVIGSAFDMAVIRLATDKRSTDPSASYNLERSALFMKLSLAGMVTLPLVALSRPVSRAVFHTELATGLIQVSCVAAMGMLAMRSIQVHVQVDQRFAAYGALDLIHSLLKFGGIVLVLGMLPPSPMAILGVVAFASLVVFAGGLFSIGKRIVTPYPGFWCELRHLVTFVRWSLLTSGIGTLGRYIDLLLLSLRSDMAEVGIFSGGQTLAAIPEMLGMYLSVIFSPRIMRTLRDGTFTPFFRRVQVTLLGIAVIGVVVGLLGMGLVRTYVLPAEYARSVTVLAILWPGVLAATVNFPLVLAFVLFVRPSFLFKLESIILPVTILFYLLVIDRYGAIGAAWVTTVSRFVRAVIVGVVAWRWALRASEMYSASPPHEVSL